MAKTQTDERPRDYTPTEKEEHLPDYYAVLGVEMTATPTMIKKAYYGLMKRYHSDKTGVRKEIYDELASPAMINEAYDVLSDEKKRKKYDKKFYAHLTKGQRERHDRFYGVRHYRYGEPIRQAKYLLGTTAEFQKTTSARQKTEVHEIVEENSITDSIEWDNLEIELGGKYDESTGALAAERFHQGGSQALQDTPWYRLCSLAYQSYVEADYEKALTYLTQLVKKIPKNIIYMYRLGLVYEALGKLEEAEKLYKAAINTAAKRPNRQACITIRKALGDLYLRMGRMEDARKIWQGVLKMKHKSIEARDVMAAMVMREEQKKPKIVSKIRRLALPWRK